jgi:hypothetical protein
MNFSDFFSTNSCNQKANAIISDNKSFILDFGTAYEYMWDNIIQNDSEIYGWLKDEEAYDKMDSAEQAVVTDMLHDWLKENYDYVPGETTWSYDESTETFNFSNGDNLLRIQVLALRGNRTAEEVKDSLNENMPEGWDANMVNEFYEFLSQD